MTTTPKETQDGDYRTAVAENTIDYELARTILGAGTTRIDFGADVTDKAIEALNRLFVKALKWDNSERGKKT